ncbi:type I methionyl aminopeptidase [Buchnera aphidicola (Mollitrichosiphum nigrofasciatum)]|uniref:type I methionyl aminopeptidase n=1 Tax=Buchnera aphidicola TaxID=9 RepID=UPI0031B7EF85
MYIKKKAEITKIRKSGIIVAKILENIKKYIKPGISTNKLNKICHELIIQEKSVPACLGYKGFPKSVCISVNDVVCHGIPNKTEILKNGDILNIDVTIIKDGYHADASKMFYVGYISKENNILCQEAQKSLYCALKVIKPGILINKIGYAIQKNIRKTSFSIVKNYCGHGIGKKFHEKPQILHYYCKQDNQIILKKGMIFTVEPMINLGSDKVQIMSDNWTVKTIDKKPSAQYEHTILVTKYGCEILTHQSTEKIPKKLNNIIKEKT